jgi:peptidoglycan/LPS O-acetylase OafA/YrhL
MRAVDTAAPAHLDALTGMRGIAAWLVVLYHIRLSLLSLVPVGVIRVLARGYLAVDVFFILSGFVLWYNYAPRLRAGGLAEAGHFLWRRVARIWPLHIVILGLFVAFALMLVATGRDASVYPFGELPLHVLLMQNWGFTTDLTWNTPAWSISTEMAASLAFPLVVAAAVWERLPTLALAALAAAVLGAIPLYFWADNDTVLGADIARLGLMRCLLEFTLGNLLCLLWLRWRDRRHAAKAALAAAAVFLAAGLALRLPETAFVPATFAALLMTLATGRGPVIRALGRPLLRYLGEISYSTYLAHMFLWLAFKLAFVGPSLQLGWGQLGGFLLLVLAASAAFYHGVEKPAQRWMNRHQPRARRHESAVPAE